VPELLVPEIVDEPFREHYQKLIRSSLLRTIEVEKSEGRRSHRPRRRNERPPAPVPVEAPAPPAPVDAPVAPRIAPLELPSRSRLRIAAPIVWGLAVLLLVVNTVVAGFDSWATGIADLGVLALTAVWFVVSLDDGRATAVVAAPPPAPPAVEEPAGEKAEAEQAEAEQAEAEQAEVEEPLAAGIAGLRVVAFPMQRDGGGHITALAGTALGAPAGSRMVACRAGTLRGMHAHARADAQRIVVQGRVALGLRDLRPGSSTEGRSKLLELSGDEYFGVEIPAGVVHGIYALSDALVLAGVSRLDEDDELGCAWNDPGLGIEWPGEPLFLSERDRRAGPLSVLEAELSTVL
jgi:dTDP-4-dehydrorhamnose 3,5-epimerase